MAKEGSDGQEKTEQPTSRRKSKARTEGNVPRSEEINKVALLFGALLYFALQGGVMVEGLRMIMKKLFTGIVGIELSIASTYDIMRTLIEDMIQLMMPLMLILIVIAVLANVFQFGFMFTLKPFKFNPSKFNTIKGLKKKVSAKNIVKLVKSIFRLIIIGTVPFFVIKSEIGTLPLVMDMTVSAIGSYIAMMILKIVFFTGLVLLVLAVIDLIYTRWKWNRDLMMSKQEVKEEHKQAEGDPKIKSKIRSLQFAMMRKAIMESVPKADVVITNPVHYAVALKYDRSEMPAPTVVAKGARKIAEKIKQIAREHNIPVIENKPLAQSLYKMVDVGDTIPESLYKAVAEVLAYVYSRKQASAAGQ